MQSGGHPCFPGNVIPALGRSVLSDKIFHLALSIILIMMLLGCKGLKPSKDIFFIVRDSTGKLVNKQVVYQREWIGGASNPASSNKYGFFSLKRKEILKDTALESQVMIITTNDKKASIPLSPYSNVFDIYLDKPGKVAESDRVADMHYHVSQRAHNLYGQKFYEPGKERQPPANINWFKEYQKKLCVYDGEEWTKVKLKPRGSKNDRTLQILFNGNWVRSKDGANNLKHFSQATFPNMRDGNVFIAYNGMGPFEHSVSNEPIKRVLTSAFKVGTHMHWNEIMGSDKEVVIEKKTVCDNPSQKNCVTKSDTVRFSHWHNFNLEYKMITGQDQRLNNFEWTYLKRSDNIDQMLKGDVPLVVNATEGGHMLQHKYFPHFTIYDLTDSTSKVTLAARKDLFEQMMKDSLNPLRAEFKKTKKAEDDIEKSPLTEDAKAKERSCIDQQKWRLVDNILLSELRDNVDSLKKMEVFMVAIGHLAYNGMVGQAQAIDVSKRPPIESLVSSFVRRAYGTRVSNDVRYRKAHDGIFYRVPGVNYFGNAVITQLLDRTNGGRIQIDLKHSDPSTRKFILEKYANFTTLDSVKNKNARDRLRPICSHCGVNGLSVDYSSPFTNEYQLLKASAVRKFYPFGMNLYDEEVKAICKQDGIIGIPLEERVLGGYIDTKVRWPHCLKRKGNSYEFIFGQGEYEKRFTYLKKVLHYLDKQRQPEMMHLREYYEKKLLQDGFINNHEQVFNLMCKDYFSAEPFLQNLFRIVDLAYLTKQEKELLKLPVKNEEEIATRSAQMMQSAKLEIQVDQQSVDVLETELRKPSWDNICIGSDLDGLIDPIDICPTASHYPLFKEKLINFIPLFLHIRKQFEPNDPFIKPYRLYEDYFNQGFEVTDALNKVFYLNLKDFTKYIVEQRSPKK